MTLNKISEQYEQTLFYVFLPITFNLWLYQVTNSPLLISTYLLISTLLLGYLVVSIKKIRLDINYMLVLLFIVYCFSLTTIYFIQGDLTDDLGRSLAGFHLKIYSLYIVSYLYGRFMSFQPTIISYLVFCTTLVFILSVVSFSTFGINFELIRSGEKGTYLLLADLFSIYLLIHISYIPNNTYRFLFFIVGCSFLFFLNSRSSLYTFIIVFSIFQFFYSSFRARIVSITLLLSAIFLLLSSSLFQILLDANPRMLAVITDIDSDGSKIARDQLFEIGLDRTLRSAVFGDYGGVVKEFGNIGSYIHNILSYWQTYGLIPFLLSIIFFIVQPSIVAYNALKNKDLFNTAPYFNIAIYLVLLLIVSKSYTWYFSWFLLGILHTFEKKKIYTLNIKT